VAFCQRAYLSRIITNIWKRNIASEPKGMIDLNILRKSDPFYETSAALLAAAATTDF
jgi:hypothetical protein